jgi:hypothetical protein
MKSLIFLVCEDSFLFVNIDIIYSIFHTRTLISLTDRMIIHNVDIKRYCSKVNFILFIFSFINILPLLRHHLLLLNSQCISTALGLVRLAVLRGIVYVQELECG